MIQDRLAPALQSAEGELHTQTIGISVNNQPTQQIGFTEHQSLGGLRSKGFAQASTRYSGIDPLAPKFLIDRDTFRECVQANAQLTGWIDDTAGNPVPIVILQVNDLAALQIATVIGQCVSVNPGMPGNEGKLTRRFDPQRNRFCRKAQKKLPTAGEN